MSRVTPDEVKEIVETTLLDPIVQVWIDGASSIVDDNSTCIGGDDAKLTQVELYLSAHFVSMLDPETRGYVSREKIDTFETAYSTPVGLSSMIDNTTYGTTANMISGGCLTNINKQACKLFSLGGSL